MTQNCEKIIILVEHFILEKICVLRPTLLYIVYLWFRCTTTQNIEPLVKGYFKMCVRLCMSVYRLDIVSSYQCFLHLLMEYSLMFAIVNLKSNYSVKFITSIIIINAETLFHQNLLWTNSKSIKFITFFKLSRSTISKEMRKLHI